MVILQKFIRDNLGISRRKAEELIWQGKIAVNGVSAKPGVMIDPEADVVIYKGIQIKPKSKKLIYIKLNKPADCVTSKSDPHNPKTVYSCLPKKYMQLSPVGRLDKDTEGLLILTNDGDLNYRLSHPKFGVEKEYAVTISGVLKPTEKKKLEHGIESETLTTVGCKIDILSHTTTKSKLTVVVHEGQKREIKRMFDFFDHDVLELKRLRIGSVLLDDLKVGEWKEIDKAEILAR